MKSIKPICLVTAILLLVPITTWANWSPACLDYADGIEHWREIRATADTVDANAHALALAECLKSPNSEARDRIAYEVLTYWLRKDRVSVEVADQLRLKLIPWLSTGKGIAGDDTAITRAFAALILSELVRHELQHKRWQAKDLNQLTEAAINMFEAESDYRGLDSEIGWIHTLAHGSDLFWRLAMHAMTTKAQQQAMLQALALQINKHGAPAFVFNEGDRMARVVSVIVARKDLSEAQITEWLNDIAEPAPMDKWNQAFSSQQGMWQLHNTKQFLRALRQAIQQQQLEEKRQLSLLTEIDQALEQLP